MTSLLRVLLVVAAAGLVAPAAASAQLPAGDFGGGAIKVPVDKAVGPGNLLMSFRSAGDGPVTVFAQFRGTCVGGGVRRTFTPGPDGTFTLTGKASNRFVFARGRSVARYTISGQLTADGGSGRASARLTRLEKGRKAQRCRTGEVTWNVKPAGDPAAAPAAPPLGAPLFGFTSQEDGDGDVPEPLVMQVGTAPSGGIAGALFGFEVACRKDKIKIDHSTFQAARRVKIRPDGTFRDVDRYKIKFADLVEKGKIVFEGRFTAAGAHGTISATSRHTDRKTKRLVDRCSSGPVTWSARP